MVAKISTGGNMFGALAYNQNKVDSGEAKVLFSLVIGRRIDNAVIRFTVHFPFHFLRLYIIYR